MREGISSLHRYWRDGIDDAGEVAPELVNPGLSRDVGPLVTLAILGVAGYLFRAPIKAEITTLTSAIQAAIPGQTGTATATGTGGTVTAPSSAANTCPPGSKMVVDASGHCACPAGTNMQSGVCGTDADAPCPSAPTITNAQITAGAISVGINRDCMAAFVCDNGNFPQSLASLATYRASAGSAHHCDLP